MKDILGEIQQCMKRPKVKMCLVCLGTVRNSVRLEHKIYMFVGQIGASGDAENGREKRGRLDLY